MTRSTLSSLQCVRCGVSFSGDVPAKGCQRCAESGVPASYTTVYDLDLAAQSLSPDVLQQRARGPSRYAELLPPRYDDLELAAGSTPLLRLRRLGNRLGLNQLWLKDESRNPTWSFKDRPAEVAASRALFEQSRGLVVSSTGNAAAATAAFAASAGLPAVLLVTETVDPVMLGFISAYRSLTIATRTKADRWTLMQHCIETWGFYPNSNYSDPPTGNDPYAVDGYKSVGFEIWEQLGFQSPSVIAMPVGYGDGLFGIFKSFQELNSIGAFNVPRLVSGEIYGSLAQAIDRQSLTVYPVEIRYDTIAKSIATRQSTYQAAYAVQGSDGLVYQVEDDEILASQRLLVEAEGIFVEAASAAGLAALLRALAVSEVGPDDVVVIVNTSSGLKSISALGHLGAQTDTANSVDELDALLHLRLPNIKDGAR